ncbi:MAG: hypothetical protein AB1566_11515 [Chloroflexota bacterium]
MCLCEGLFREFDRRGFLGIRIWEFIGYSLGRPYAHYVARELALRHPLKFVRGFLAYRRFVREKSAGGGVFRAAPEGRGLIRSHRRRRSAGPSSPSGTVKSLCKGMVTAEIAPPGGSPTPAGTWMDWT